MKFDLSDKPLMTSLFTIVPDRKCYDGKGKFRQSLENIVTAISTLIQIRLSTVFFELPQLLATRALLYSKLFNHMISR